MRRYAMPFVVSGIVILMIVLFRPAPPAVETGSGLPGPSPSAPVSPVVTDPAPPRPLSTPDDPGYRLASIQLGYRPDPSDPVVTQMRDALSDLSDRVAPDNAMHEAGIVYATRKDLADNGIDETMVQVCRELTEAAPADPRMDLQSVAAGYLVLREPPDPR